MYLLVRESISGILKISEKEHMFYPYKIVMKFKKATLGEKMKLIKNIINVIHFAF